MLCLSVPTRALNLLAFAPGGMTFRLPHCQMLRCKPQNWLPVLVPVVYDVRRTSLLLLCRVSCHRITASKCRTACWPGLGKRPRQLKHEVSSGFFARAALIREMALLMTLAVW